MDTIKLINKPPFLTPLQTIDIFRKKHPEYETATLGYAGRLDPLAEGLLLVLVNDENKHRKIYERLDKEYTCTALFGLTTDSYDYMGLFTQEPKPSQDPSNTLKTILPTFIGKQMQEYPMYSSARVNGKPLYYWARNNVTDIKIPTKEITIFDITCKSIQTISLSKFAQFAVDGISKVEGKFRQEEIINQWNTYLNIQDQYFVADLHITCSSGTYVRGLIHEIGTKIGSGALAYNIKRTRVGEYSLDQAILL